MDIPQFVGFLDYFPRMTECNFRPKNAVAEFLRAFLSKWRAAGVTCKHTEAPASPAFPGSSGDKLEGLREVRWSR